jgi:putative transposase
MEGEDGRKMKKKRYDMKLKKKIVEEALRSNNMSEVARRHGLAPRTVRGWVKQYEVKGDLWKKTRDSAKRVSANGQDVSYKTIMKLREKIYQLEKEMKKQKEGDQLRITILEDLIKKLDLCPQDRIEVAECWMRQGYSQNRTLDIVHISKSVYQKYRRNKKNIPQNDGQKIVRMNHKRKKKKGNIPGYALDGQGKKISDQQVMDIVVTHLEENKFDAYGYRKLAYKLRKKKNIIVNHKKMYRLCKEEGLLRYRGRRRRSSPPAHRAYERHITAPNQLWEMDIQHERLPNGTPFFVLSILDVFDRVIVFSNSYLSCKSGDVVKAAQTALDQYVENGEDKPVLRTDNGSQFISHEFHGFVEAEGIYHERIPVQSPNHNAHIESYHSLVRINFFERFEFCDFKEFHKEHAAFVKHYNEEYCHGSLGNLTPHEYREIMKQVPAGDRSRVVKVI